MLSDGQIYSTVKSFIVKKKKKKRINEREPEWGDKNRMLH